MAARELAIVMHKGGGRFGVLAMLVALLASCAAPTQEQGAAPALSVPDSTRSVEPPSVRFGPLFDRVALSHIFEDGKAWADAVPKRAPGEILRDWRRQQPRSEARLRAFVDANFELPPDFSAPPLPGANLELKAHIERLWPILTRTTTAVPRYSSLLPLPRSYVVPGGRFREIYYWDSYFTMLGLGPAQEALKRDMVANFAHLIRTYGHVPNGNRSYYLSRSQPPFFFKMVELTRPGDPAKAFAAYLPELKAEHAFWMKGSDRAALGEPVARVVRMPDGSLLNRYWDDRDAPRDESYAADVATAQASNHDPRIVYRNLRAGAESGWDFSSRWFADGTRLSTVRTTEIVPPDLNSLLHGLEMAIARGCAEVKDEGCVRAFSGKAEARARAIRAWLWNGRSGLFDDYDWKARRLLGNVSAAAFYPLFFNIATQDQAESVAVVASRELVKSGGLVTTNRTTGQQWDSPNGWAPLQWIAVNGLRNYGQKELASTIAARWLRTVSTVYASTGKLLEKYDVVTLRPGGGGEYPLQDGFGWTNGTTIALMKVYSDALSGANVRRSACRAVLAERGARSGRKARLGHLQPAAGQQQASAHPLQLR